MEPITANVHTVEDVRVVKKHAVSGYLYTIQGVQVFLHEDVRKPGLYTCTEFITGRTLCRQQPTMQECLDKTNEKIAEKELAEINKQIKLVVERDGYANEPEACLWCNTIHTGGPENCKE
jgi:hypothetical protein